jgi:predicted ATPase/DNA-binding winged helix-turn-helix (wHTH) protein
LNAWERAANIVPAMPTSLDEARDGLSFGPFHLLVRGRLLTREGVPVELGARALDLLIVLISSPHEVIGKADLIARVWPDVVVEEGSLRFHMNGLRKALGDGRDGARYIATLPGRGYCFVAPISRPDDRRAPQALDFRHFNLPSRLNATIGREEDVIRVSALLAASRIVTIVGAGGVGKTTVAMAVAHQMSEAFERAVLFVDFGLLGDPDLAASAIASMLDLSVGANDARASLIAWLRDKHVLLVLDTCEHLIDAVAMLAESIAEGAPRVHILATSREALRVDGERVYKLEPLPCPPDEPDLTAEAILSFPAPRLFVERAMASGASLDLDASDAQVVAGICRKLDGVALAIELAARRVESCGLVQTAQLLDRHLELEWPGLRTAPPRQKTLHATLDWSFGLLAGPEPAVLRRLAKFVGPFTLDAALEVIAGADLDRSNILGAIDSLVNKSMLATMKLGAAMHYRLLDTTRDYALQIEAGAAERASLGLNHASHYRRWLEQFGVAWPAMSTGTDRAPYFAALNNVRAALEYCFGPEGDVEAGIGLAAAAAPVLLGRGLMSECHRWSDCAIRALDAAATGGPDEMVLQAVLGISSMYMLGGRDEALAALNRSIEIAEALGNELGQLRILGELYMLHLRVGEFRATLDYARRAAAITATSENSSTVALGHFLLGTSLHFLGDLRRAGEELGEPPGSRPRSRKSSANYLGYEEKSLFAGILARNLWLQGYPDPAVSCARQNIDEAMERDHSLTLCIALLGASSVSLWRGDLASAEAQLERLISRAESYSLLPYVLVGRGSEGVVALRRGDAKGGVETISRYLEKLHAATYEVSTTPLAISLGEGLCAIGRFDDAIALIDTTIGQVETRGDLCYLPEALRVRANVLLAMQRLRAGEAEEAFTRSLELSRRQGARAWELRTATDLARLWAGQERSADAQALLRPVFEQFDEGLATPDLKAAENLLAGLH